MKKLKNIIAISTLTLTTPLFASAQITNPISSPDLSTLLNRIIDIIIMLATPIVVVSVIYSGFLFVTAGGNEQKITLAKKILFWTLIGALILLGARVIATAVSGTVDSLSA